MDTDNCDRIEDDDDIEVLDNDKAPTPSDKEGQASGTDKKQKSSSHSSSSSSDDDGIKIIDEVNKGGGGDSNSKLSINPETGEMEAIEDDEDDDDDEEDRPTIRLNTGIFDADDDDEEEEQSNAEVFNVGTSNPPPSTTPPRPTSSSSGPDLARRTTPRRAAAQAAASNIKVMTDILQDKGQSNTRLPMNNFTQNKSASASGPVPDVDTQRVQCHQCKKFQPSQIVVQQFGTDIHLCSNFCFNAFRNPDPARRPLACSKCGTLSRDIDTAKTFYWETMNFCSDICVCNFQMEIGAKCSSCQKKVAWTSLGKYCVRFGSDIRQFCSAQCLEAYKKNARVCFHCQLDIKRLGNVILANIPAKAQPKEFCSQDCVEMYVEQNLNQQIISKPDVMITCVICSQIKKLLKALVLKGQTLQTCSDYCWRRLLDSRLVHTAAKCETCTKYVNTEALTTSFYLASDARTFGFCSATCKNVYVLKNRQILACTTCKVKKYNYDLIEFVNAHNTEYVVCSLNCLPRPSQYVINLKTTVLSLAPTASSLIGPRTVPPHPAATASTASYQMQSSMSVASTATVTSLTSLIPNGHSTYNSATDGSSDIMLRQIRDDDVIEIRDGEVIEEETPLDDERWAECETMVIVREPEPVPMRNKGCMVRPVRITKETQTSTEELWEMPRVEVRPPATAGEGEKEPEIRYVPVVIPCPVFIPVPFYALQTPVPIPFPVPMPIPIPLPVDSNFFRERNSEDPVPMETDND